MDKHASAAGVALAGCAALAAAMGIGRFAFTPLLPMMQADQGLTVAQGGWLASANYVGYLIGGLTAALLRVKPATVIRVSLALIAVATFAMAGTRSIALWLVLRAVAGVASAWVLVQVSSWGLERLSVLGRPGLGSVVFSGVGAGIALAGAVCLVLMRQGVPAREAWLALGAASLLLAAIAWPSVGQGAPARPAAGPGAGGHFAWTSEGWRIVLGYGLFGFGYIIPATFVPAMARELVRDPNVFGWSWPMFGAAAMLSTLGAGALLAQWGNRRVWTASALVMAGGVALPALFGGLLPIMACAACVGGTFMVLTMTGLREGRRLGGPHAHTLMAAMTSAFAAGQIAGPLAVSWAARAGVGIEPVLILASLLLVLSAALVVLPPSTERNPIEALPE